MSNELWGAQDSYFVINFPEVQLLTTKLIEDGHLVQDFKNNILNKEDSLIYLEGMI
jgi:hypothetical protein